MLSQKLWWLSIGCLCVLMLAACGTKAVALSRAQQILRQAQQAKLHDATFTVAFTADGASNTGSGTLTTTPSRYQLQVRHTTSSNQAAQLAIIDDASGAAVVLFAKVVGDTLWSTLNDGEDGAYSNFDTDILDYAQLSALTLVGSSTSQGQAAWHLHAETSIQLYDIDGSLNSVKGTEDLWLRQSDAFPLMLQKSFAAAAPVIHGTIQQLPFQATYQFHAWNTGVTIDLPSQNQVSASG